MKYSTDDLKKLRSTSLPDSRVIIQAAIDEIERLQSEPDESAKLWRDTYSVALISDRGDPKTTADKAVELYEQWLDARGESTYTRNNLGEGLESPSDEVSNKPFPKDTR